MSWFSSLGDLDNVYDPEDGERYFVDVATHGFEPWIRIILQSGGQYKPEDVERINAALQEALNEMKAPYRTEKS